MHVWYHVEYFRSHAIHIQTRATAYDDYSWTWWFEAAARCSADADAAGTPGTHSLTPLALYMFQHHPLHVHMYGLVLDAPSLPPRSCSRQIQCCVQERSLSQNTVEQVGSDMQRWCNRPVLCPTTLTTFHICLSEWVSSIGNSLQRRSQLCNDSCRYNRAARGTHNFLCWSCFNPGPTSLVWLVPTSHPMRICVRLCRWLVVSARVAWCWTCPDVS